MRENTRFVSTKSLTEKYIFDLKLAKKFVELPSQNTLLLISTLLTDYRLHSRMILSHVIYAFI